MIRALYTAASGMSAQQQNAIPDAYGLRNGMRHKENGGFRFIPQLQQFLLHLDAS